MIRSDKRTQIVSAQFSGTSTTGTDLWSTKLRSLFCYPLSGEHNVEVVAVAPQPRKEDFYGPVGPWVKGEGSVLIKFCGAELKK